MEVFRVRVQMLWYNFQYRNSISSFDYSDASVKPETSVEGNVEGDVDGDSMDYARIPPTSLVGSGLTLFSGFGLGTLLMPALNSWSFRG
jgi:hypothetical protein